MEWACLILLTAEVTVELILDMEGVMVSLGGGFRGLLTECHVG